MFDEQQVVFGHAHEPRVRKDGVFKTQPTLQLYWWLNNWHTGISRYPILGGNHSTTNLAVPPLNGSSNVSDPYVPKNKPQTLDIVELACLLQQE